MVTELAALVAPALDQSAVAAFAAALRGDVLQAGDLGYDEARRIWNGRIDRDPVLVARCAGASDVVAAVEFAQANGLHPSVRGGGHSVSGSAVADGELMIDLSPMKGIALDAVQGIARIESGLTWGEVARQTAPFGLAIPSGKVSTTGVGGLALGGGIGWLVRKHGLTIDHLRSVEIVTADGSLLTASEVEHFDLFWGVRGGGNFGVVTSFAFDLVPVAEVYAGLVAYPIAAGRDVLRFYRDFAADAPDEMTMVAALIMGPDGAKLVGIAGCYAGLPEDGERTLRPLRQLGEPVMDQVGALPYAVFSGAMDAMAPTGMNRIWRSGFLNGLPDDAIDALVGGFEAARPALSTVLIEQCGGAMGRVAPDATAFPHRDVALNLALDAGWAGGGGMGANRDWIEGVRRSMQPHLSGAAYVNFLDDEGPDRVKAAYGANYPRLVALKNRYDPTNFFRYNQNIPPDPDELPLSDRRLS